MGRKIVLGVFMSVVVSWGVGQAWTVDDHGRLGGERVLAPGIGSVERSLREEFAAPASEMVSEGEVPVKSPKKAFLLSAVVPGGGQIYNGAVMRAAIFLGIEAISWTGYALWTKKGGDIEDDYKALADAHWDPEQYFIWKGRYVDVTGDTSHFTHSFRDKEGKEVKDIVHYERIKGDIVRDQQYYEMIGKYHQFRAGWDDYPEELRTAYVDSVWEGGRREDYMDQRAESNRYLKRAGYTVGVLLINHVISAIEAAKYASRYGSEEVAQSEERVQVRAALWRDGDERIPALVVSKRF